ncbi:hypothetical protein DAPK24_049920 [Pichia kluyveri]|uniref:LicD/FKTN/FKRP nucleotidyltransferase domain-containing protein n=1 Tax=Pichia kluyveri TaxID=36015 RepID=A0AAV5RCR6_PICKL|nr:hypothetical protein DAPK24_049920 [Pichia kluyveri]
MLHQFAPLRFRRKLASISLLLVIVQNETSIAPIINSIYKILTNPKIDNLNPKFTSHFINSKIDTELDEKYIKSYLEFRQSKHLYDPIITLSVYLNYLNTQYSENSVKIPFSWEDWVDLSYLNEFLDDGKSLTCKQFVDKYKYEIDFEWNDSTPSSSLVDKTNCLDTMDYIITDEGKHRSKKLLPGFNFQKKLDKVSTFMGKAYNAKSYLLSYAPKPDFIYFLTDNGKYFRAETKQSSSMLRNGLLKNFLTSESYNGFNPIEQLSKLNKFYEIEHEHTFKLRLNNDNNYQIDIPDENFDVDFATRYKYLFETDDSLLKDNELNFKNSLKRSFQMKTEDIPKYLDEVNITPNHEYRGHKVRENGNHYDSRFFAGFISEMPASEISIHNPRSILNNSEIKSTATPENIKNSILSHLSHLLFTVTFNDGLFLIPAHGTLLSWYFNSMSFPWDEDADVQMPIGDLAEFCLRYNNSMVVENPKYGTAKGYVDCGTAITHREKGNGNNIIDARIIDVDSGMYIDITGLSVSEDEMDENYLKKFDKWVSNELKIDYNILQESRQKEVEMERAYKLRDERERAEKEKLQRERELLKIEKENLEKEKESFEAAKKNYDNKENKNDADDKQRKEKRNLEKSVKDIHKQHKIFNCRNRHFYSYDQFSPLRLTLYEGAPTLVAVNDSALRSQVEIDHDALFNTEHKNYHFSKPLRAWLYAYDILQAELAIGLNPKPDKSVNEIKKNNQIEAREVCPTYRENQVKVFYELVKQSIYDTTSEDLIYTYEYLMDEERNLKNQSQVINYLSKIPVYFKTEKKPFINIFEEVYHNKELTHAHEAEMKLYDNTWNLSDPNIIDNLKPLTNKESLGEWMLKDHAPPRVPLYDYIKFAEQEFKIDKTE